MHAHNLLPRQQLGGVFARGAARLARTLPCPPLAAGCRRHSSACGRAEELGPRVGACLFTADGQLKVWVRLVGQTVSGKETTLLSLAPTFSLLDALDGEVVGTLPLKRLGERVRKGEPILHLNWEGCRMSAADELYHSIFEASSGSFAVTAPVDGTIVSYNDAVLVPTAAVDDSTWLVQLEASDSADLLGLLDAEVVPALS
ncbi:hypothetical protein T492DRAFT_832507 [Pavlovales sp. CCMP2436]|nr:hypothetical protein T492DRAFT_832507 [Pavlovales sp. CCMP2436]